MANYKQVSLDSSGDDVKTLQEALGFTGADVDGIFGPKTQQAVMDYQKANGLDVDGIVGEKTWGSLMKGNTPATTAPTTTTPETTTPSTEGTGFTFKPFEYQWQTQRDEIFDKILNRDKFSYDINADALYQQYKDQYVLGGQMAMMDTMGQAAALTGGYGNSYAQTVGQQTYQGYLQQLNDKVPELYQLALDQYTREGDEMYKLYGLYADREDQEYGMWLDKVNMEYGMHRDEVADQQWQAQFDKQYGDSSGGSGGSSGGNTGGTTGSYTGGSYTANPGFDREDILSIQQQAGIAEDGIWGPDTANAYDSGIRPKEGGPVLKDSAAAKSFRASLMDGTTFARHGNKVFMGEAGKGGQVYTFDSYNEYIEAAIDRELEAGRISDDDAAFLYNLYFNK